VLSKKTCGLIYNILDGKSLFLPCIEKLHPNLVQEADYTFSMSLYGFCHLAFVFVNEFM